VNPQPDYKSALSTIEKVMEFLRLQTFSISSPRVQRAGCVLRRVEVGDTDVLSLLMCRSTPTRTSHGVRGRP
jgi:hypothetical protein